MLVRSLVQTIRLVVSNSLSVIRVPSATRSRESTLTSPGADLECLSPFRQSERDRDLVDGKLRRLKLRVSREITHEQQGTLLVGQGELPRPSFPLGQSAP